MHGQVLRRIQIRCLNSTSYEASVVVSQLRMLWGNTQQFGVLLSMHVWVMILEFCMGIFFCNHDVGACIF